MKEAALRIFICSIIYASASVLWREWIIMNFMITMLNLYKGPSHVFLFYKLYYLFIGLAMLLLKFQNQMFNVQPFSTTR